jgi:hypothetical protein
LLLAFALLGILLAYVGNYVARSLQGRYEPAVIGLGGVKWYDWAPKGFVTDLQWDADLMRFYYPLWVLDDRLWHRPVSSSGRTSYPINEPEHIGEVYRAWEPKDDKAHRK